MHFLDRLPLPTVRFGLPAFALLLGLCALLPGCGSTESSSDGPVFRLHGTKPKPIRLGVSLYYVATTHSPGCRSLSFATGKMEPIRRTIEVWPEEPKEIWRSGDENDRGRIVPYASLISNVDSLREQNRSAFDWEINVGWKGAPYGCGFELQIASLSLHYNDSRFDGIDNGYVGGVAFENIPKHTGQHSRTRSVVPDDIYFLCRAGGLKTSRFENADFECALIQSGQITYRFQENLDAESIAASVYVSNYEQTIGGD